MYITIFCILNEFFTCLHVLTKIRNANRARKLKVFIPKTNLNLSIVRILKDEGFIQSFDIFSDKNVSSFISISLKYKGLSETPYITNLVRISKPGFRIYVKKTKIPKVLGGVGIAICPDFNFLQFFYLLNC